MLRLVKDGEATPQNEALREALERVTRGSPTQAGLPILNEHEAEAIYRVMASRHFTQARLDAWVERLLADHPYDRKAVGPQPGLWVWIKWVFLGGDKPQMATTESVDEWRRRAERYVDEQKVCVDEPTWLERPLQALTAARHQIERETGKSQWAMPVMRWALVQLLTIPSDVDTSDARATAG